MTKVQSLTMSGLGLVALVVGVILAGMAVTSAQEGTATPAATPEATTGAGTSTPSTTDDATDDSTGDSDSDAGCVGGGGAHGGFGGWRAVEDAAATVLGITEEDLHAGFDDGKTLTGIAADKGMSAADFSAAVKAQVTSDLQAKLDAGYITQDEFDQVTSDLDTNLDDLLNSVGHGPGPRGHHGRPGGFSDFRGDDNSADTDTTTGA